MYVRQALRCSVLFLTFNRDIILEIPLGEWSILSPLNSVWRNRQRVIAENYNQCGEDWGVILSDSCL